MKLEQTFEVQAPLAMVWAALNDLERVAPCLPGAAITGHDEDGTYRGTFTVKLGPMTAAYNGTIKIEDADESTHSATLKARGTDKRGQGGANATIVNTLSANGGATRVEAVTDFTITGRLAQFGRGGMMEDVSNRLLREFAACLQTRLVDEAEPEPAAAAAAEPAAPSDGGPVPASAPPPRAATPPPDAAPLKGGSLFLSVLWERIKRIFGRK
jgi:carbon monoxide dehydrogenase subunit G